MSKPSTRALIVASVSLGLAVGIVPSAAHADSQTAQAELAAGPALPKAKPDYGGTPPLWVEHPYLKKVGKRAEIRGSVYVDPYRRPGAKNKKHRNKKADPDRLRFRVVVGSKRFTDLKKSHSINPNLAKHVVANTLVTKKVSKRGLVPFKVRLSKKASRVVLKRTHRQRMRSTVINVEHWKDTFGAKKSTPKWGLKQHHDAGLQKKKATKKQRKGWLESAKIQIRADRRLVNVYPKSQSQLSWSGSSPMYNYVYVTNSTPFEQQVQFNPNIQCMWTGSSQLNPGVQTANLNTGSLLQMVYVLEPNPYSSGDSGSAAWQDEAWSGLYGATSNMNPPNDPSSLTGDLVKASAAAGQSLLQSATQTSTYSEEGAIAAAGDAALTFLETFFVDVFNGAGCNNVSSFPEQFALSSAVVGFGTNGANNAWNANLGSFSPNTWMTTAPIAAPASTTVNVNGPTDDPTFETSTDGQNCDTAYNTGSNSCYWTGATQVGSQSTNFSMSECPAPTPGTTPSQWCNFVYNTLQPMLGAQTTSTYYWNGGMPAPMVSNNASSGSFVGGAASYQGGLFQSVGPNPGLPGDAWCWGSGEPTTNCSYADNYTMWSGRLHNYNPMGAMNIQLTYLTTPQFSSGMVTNGAPQASVSATSGGIDVTCDMSSISTQLNTPFSDGTTNVSDSTLASVDTTTNGTQNPTDTQWLVTFYGLDEDGNFVYYNADPGQPVDRYQLAPEAALQYVPFVTSGTPNSPVGTVLDTNLGNMQTVQAIQSGSTEIATLAKVGCSAVPMVNLQGLDVTGGDLTVAGNFGQAASNSSGTNGWPLPPNSSNDLGYGWPMGLYQQYGNLTNFSWQTPVNALNVSFQGLPTVATAAVDCSGTTSCSPSSGG